MTEFKAINKVKNKNHEAKNSQYVNLSVDERLRIFANLVIDRVLEDRAQGKIPGIVKGKED